MNRQIRPFPALALATGLSLLGYGQAVPAAPPLEAYGNLPQVELVRVSPSGSRIAMIGVGNDKRQLVVTDMPQNTVLKAAAVRELVVRDLSWAGDEQVRCRCSTGRLSPKL